MADFGFEREVLEYFDHAIALRHAVLFLRGQKVISN
jgi:hypothetical protein